MDFFLFGQLKSFSNLLGLGCAIVQFGCIVFVLKWNRSELKHSIWQIFNYWVKRCTILIFICCLWKSNWLPWFRDLNVLVGLIKRSEWCCQVQLWFRNFVNCRILWAFQGGFKNLINFRSSITQLQWERNTFLFLFEKILFAFRFPLPSK